MRQRAVPRQIQRSIRSADVLPRDTTNTRRPNNRASIEASEQRERRGSEHRTDLRKRCTVTGLVYSVFKDREGNLWFGTTGGVDRFRENKVLPFSTTEDVNPDQQIALASAGRRGV